MSDSRAFKALCVFCGSSTGNNGAYHAAAIAVAEWLVAHDIALVFGGGKVGLMGVVADGVLARGGRAYGVIPELLMHKEIAHAGLTELFVTTSMHERKQKMYELADGFIALPGGLGTMDEIFEILTWSQLGLHQKPCGFLNVEGYFDEMLRFLDTTVHASFLKAENRDAILSATTIVDLFAKMQAFAPTPVPQWIQTPQQV